MPNGWQGAPPAADAIEGISTITNYTEADVRANGLEQEGWLPPGALKIQMMSESINVGRSLEELMNASVEQEMTPNTTGHIREVEPMAVELWPYSLAGYKGYITIIDRPLHPPSLLIQLQINEGRAIRIGLTPATSDSLNEGLRIANTISSGEQSIDPHRFNLPVELPASLRDELSTRNFLVPTAVQGTCPSGTFPGNEAPAVPATLHMPFRAGEYWRVGDQGSYFGNGAHCNSNNDYYATDWNRSNASGQYQPDHGYHVLPVANGTVTYSACITTGYGCHIKVVHDLDGIAGNDHETIYAHLSSRNVISGSNVTHSTKIGEVGNTGNSTSAHLHLSVRKFHIDHYDSHCHIPGQNCPNGEPPNHPSANWPQTDRPRNFFSQNVGVFILVDGQWWQSENQ